MEVEINLLPPYRKEEIIKAKRLKNIFKLEGLIFFVLVVFFSFLLCFNYILKLDLSSLPDDSKLNNNQEKYDKVKEYDEAFSRINSKLDDAIKIKADQLYWSGLLVKISEKISDEVEISVLSTKNYDVSLVGKAKNRDKLISFKAALEEEICFADVNLPLSNLVSKEDIDFQMNFKMKEECVKKQ